MTAVSIAEGRAAILAVALFALVADASDWYVAAPRHQPLFVESARHAELAEGRMNVAELITLLEAMPQDARVYVDSPHMDEATSVDKVVVPVTYGPNAGGQELLVRVR